MKPPPKRPEASWTREDLMGEMRRLREELALERDHKSADREALLEMQREAEASRHRYADLYDFAPAGYVSLDGAGCIRDINLTGASLLGRSRTELINRPLLPMVAAADRRKWMDHLGRLRRGDASASVEVTVVRADGSQLEIRCHSIRAPGEDPIGQRKEWIRTALTDISAQRLAEQAVDESRQRLASLIESAMDAVISVDQEQGIVLFNPAAEAMFGLPAAEALGGSIDRFIPERFRGAHARHIRNFAVTGETSRRMGELGLIHGRRGNGEEFPIEASISQADVGGRKLMTVILRDVTERLRAEKELRESRQDLAHAQAVASVGSWRLDLRRNELRWSDEAHRIFGVPPGTPLTYETFLGAVHPEDRERVDRAWQDAVAGKPYDIEHRIVAGGRVKWLRERAELEFDKAGVLLGGFGTVQDITKSKEAEQELRRLAQFPEENPNPVLRAGPGGELLYANAPARAWLATLGWKPGAAIPDAMRAVTARALSENEVVQTEFTGPAGEVFWITAVRPSTEDYVNLYSRNITARKAAEDEVRRFNADLERRVEARTEELRRLAARVASIQDEEQRRISEGLHDGVAQLLVACTFKLAAWRASVSSKRPDPLLAELEQLLDEALRAIRTMTFELAAATLAQLGLEKALEELCAVMTARHGVHFHFEVQGATQPLGREAGTILFKATREVMFNVVKHAGVQEAGVCVARGTGSLRITVEDRGKGFRQAASPPRGRARSGVGLLSVRERMRTIGGWVTIQSTPGVCTRVSLTLPMGRGKGNRPPPATAEDRAILGF